MNQYEGSGGTPPGHDPWGQTTGWDQSNAWTPQAAGPDAATQWGTYQAPQPNPPQPNYGGQPQFVTPPPYFTGGPAPQRNRTALVVTLGAVAAVILIAVLVVGIVMFTGSSKKDSAGDMVQAYLEALARGDAEAALSYSADQPASMDFLTDEILKQQIDEMPITDITILGDDASSSVGIGSVHVTAKFGDKTSDVTLFVTRQDDEWKLDSATVRMDNTASGIGSNEASATLTMFGKPIRDTMVYVFPGFIEWGTDNDNIEVASGDPLLLDSLGVGGYAMTSNIKYQISDAGDSAIRTTLQDKLDTCAQSTSLQPANCPQSLYEYGAIDGSVRWTAPSADDAEITFYEYDLTASISMTASWGYTVRVEGGQTETGNESTYMYGDADLAQEPVEVTFG